MNLRNLSKLDKILYLKKIKFNTPRFIDSFFHRDKLYQFFKENFGKKFSIRSQSLFNRYLLPHYPNAELNESLFNKLCSDMEKNYVEMLFFEPIDPNETIFRGNIHIDKKAEIIEAEIMEGPGTVRDIEKASIDTVRYVKTSPSEYNSSFINEILRFHSFTLIYATIPIMEYVLEFSKLKAPKGELNVDEIFWEIREF